MLKKLRKAFNKDLFVDGAIAALLIGLVSELLGVDIAPAEVDAIVTGAAALAAIVGRWRMRKKTAPAE